MIYLATDEGVLTLNGGQVFAKLGPRGLAIRSVAPHPHDPDLLLAASADQGVFLKRGRRWHHVVRNIAHSVAWEVTGKYAYAGLRGVHLLMAEQAWGAWRELEGAHAAMGSPDVPRPHVPGHPLDILWILTPREDLVYLGVEAGGVLRSANGGSRWESASRGLHPDIHALALHAEHPNIVYAATGAGFYQTSDGGRSWMRTDEGMDRRYLSAVTVVPPQPGLILTAGSPDPPSKWGRPEGARAVVFRSTDGGSTWQRATRGLPTELPEEITALVCDPGSTEVIAATEGGEVLRSGDGGMTWQLLVAGLPPIWGAAMARGAGETGSLL